MARHRAGIVGAGISGASCAGTLAAAGWDVDVFEKAHGTGGRLSSRRTEQGWATLGSPFISVKRDPFRSQLRDWMRQGWLAPVRGDVLQGRVNLSRSRVLLQNHYRPTIEPSQLENGQVRGDYDCIICSVPAQQAVPMFSAAAAAAARTAWPTCVIARSGRS